MPSLPIPPMVYHPRALVVLNVLLDDQIPGSPGTPVAYTVIPTDASWSNNSARKANTAQVELNYRDFPMDPRALKGIALSIHVEDVFVPSLPPFASIVNRRFVGIVDTPETDLGEDGETVRLTCRDYTGIWLDTKLGNFPPISLLQPLGAIVEALRLLITPLILPAVFTSPASYFLIPGMTKGKTVLTPGKDQSAWDILSELTQIYGLLPVFEGDVLTIRTATRSSVNVRSMIYGQNVSRLSFKRDMSQEPRTKVVVIKSWDPVLGIAVSGKWIPPGALTRTKVGEKGVTKISGEEVIYQVVGSYTPADLIVLAKRIYDEQATQQIEGTMETREMMDSTFLPLTGLGNSDVLLIHLGRDLQSGISGMSPPEAIAFLSNIARPNSLSPIVAAALVAAWAKAGQAAVTFYVREAHHSWNVDQGYTLKVDFINFLIGQGL